MKDFRDVIGAYLTQSVRDALKAVPGEALARATELRIRAGQQPVLCGQGVLSLPGIVTAEEVRAMADAMLGHAAHARQEELRQGYVTLPGGFRAGLCGRAAVKDGAVSALTDIASIAIRIAREIPGCAEPLMRWLMVGERPVSALVVSPPGLGKTTMLRDAARLLSQRGIQVVIVDERSELAACLRGVPTLDVGANTDVLDGCPKAEGIRLALRAMAPRAIITDELGKVEDAMAVQDAARCGVAVIASAHAGSWKDVEDRPSLKAMLAAGTFERVIALSSLGQIGAVYDALGGRLA